MTKKSDVTSKEIRRMVGKFQCVGCTCGMAPETCDKYDYSEGRMRCVSHSLGTFGGGGPFALGLPKGFNKPGFSQDGRKETNINVRLYRKGTHPIWNHLNIPVWGLEEDGFLFVRTFAPRINLTWVDVIKGGKLALCGEEVIDVGNFYNDID